MSPKAQSRRGIAAILAFGLLFGPGASVFASPAPGGGVIRGIIYRMDETTRLAGTVVTAINVSTGRRYASNYTGDNGAYEITELPAGTYDIAIEAQDQRVYVTNSLIDLAERQRLYLSFSLKPKEGAAGAEGAGQAEGPGQAQIACTDPNALPASGPAPRAAKKKGFWHGAGGATILGILVAGAVGAGVAAQRGN